MKIKTITKLLHNDSVYNITTEPSHTYIANNCLVHNCHEQSAIRGKHCLLKDFVNIIDSFHSGVELALGGGDPFSHPDIEAILLAAYDKGLISNITVNSMHLSQHYDIIEKLIKKNHIKGLGVSYAKEFDDIVKKIQTITDNVVVHLIAGVNTASEAMKLLRSQSKILILGYKEYGFGIHFKSDAVDANIKNWNYWIRKIMTMGIVSFDNLAIDQLKIQSRIHKEVWDDKYMGDEGSHTMYVDVVKNEFAVSSTSSKKNIDGQNINEMFQVVRSLTNH